MITIIGILIALLLPAVQAAREAARRAQCQNNLKQIALALHNYHAAVGSFPPGGITEGPCCATKSRINWAIAILPYLEQQALFDLPPSSFILLLAGCGGAGYEVAPVSGRVTLDGKPLAGAHVSF